MDQEQDHTQAQSSNVDASPSTSSSPANVSARAEVTEHILDGTVFEVQRSDGDRVTCICKFCKRTISGSRNVTSNFWTHLKRKHPEDFNKFNEQKADAGGRKRLKKTTTSLSAQTGMSGNTGRLGQSKLNFPAQGVQSNKTIHVNSLIMDYIVSSMSPLSTVENEAFKKLITTLCPGVQVMTRKTLSKRISEEFSRVHENVEKSISNASYVCITADVWTSRRKSFMGITAHWIEDKTFIRRSAILACRRFPSPHTYDKIAMLLQKVFDEFSIHESKIVGVVTDNGANFVKAFKQFRVDVGINTEIRSREISPHPAREESNQGITTSAEELDTDAFGDEYEDVNCETNLSEIMEGAGIAGYNSTAMQADLEAHGSDTPIIVLPPHFTCACHTLSLVATKDFMKTNDKRVLHATMGKCSKLWNLSSHSSKTAEKVKEICGKQLPGSPCPTRWNSLFDNVVSTLKVKESLNVICEAVQLAKFKTYELEFLEEYEIVMGAIAAAIDKLQGDKDTFLGDLLPILLRTKKAMVNYSNSDTIKYMKNFAAAMAKGIEKRFVKMLLFDSADANIFIVASVSHPFFKLRWVPQEHIEMVKNLFVTKTIETCREDVTQVTSADMSESDHSVAPATNNEKEDFFSFENQVRVINYITPETQIHEECKRYFDDVQTDIHILNKYPCVKKMFLMHNTVLPSSASVERLFSYANMVLEAKRSCLSDVLFETLVLLKCNKDYQ